jgi:hypothetical protein
MLGSARFDLVSRFSVKSLAGTALGVLLASGLAGCPTNPPPADGSMRDAPSVGPNLPAATNGTPSNPTMSPANYACLGTATGPMPGTDITYPFQLRGFGSGDEVRTARVWFFPDNILADTCTGSCIEFTTDMMGNGSVTSPASGWYAYRVFQRNGATMASTYVDSVQVNEPAPGPGGGTVEANAVSVSTLNLIPAAYGFMRVPTTAIVAGEVQDCDGDQVRGAIVRLFNADGSEIIHDPEGVTAPHIQYFDGMENPDNATEYTQVDGLYAAANLTAPATGFGSIRAEAWGIPSEGAELTRLGCEVVGIYSDGVSIVNIGPERSDYPLGHPCL